ncbi:hypothetical protein [Scytonema sp. HK-05]|nr:hypothetical protein [Scytonema sp. HK-05]
MEIILTSKVFSPLAQLTTDVLALPNDQANGLKVCPNWGSIRKF